VTVSSGRGELTAFHAEADAFTAILGELSAQAWLQPTRCVPWQVRDLVGHVITVLARVTDMVSAPGPDRPDTTATTYYRADHRFSNDANADRVRTARVRAAGSDAAILARDVAETAQTVITSYLQEPADRVVATRHGDAMLLSDFLSTRLVELAVHGLDVADAVGLQPWLTTLAAEHLQQLLFGMDWRTGLRDTAAEGHWSRARHRERVHRAGETRAPTADSGLRIPPTDQASAFT
jgi:uncharacterized protein (TIGR03083 family)